MSYSIYPEIKYEEGDILIGDEEGYKDIVEIIKVEFEEECNDFRYYFRIIRDSNGFWKGKLTDWEWASDVDCWLMKPCTLVDTPLWKVLNEID